jgi:hypothetical protein
MRAIPATIEILFVVFMFCLLCSATWMMCLCGVVMRLWSGADAPKDARQVALRLLPLFLHRFLNLCFHGIQVEAGAFLHGRVRALVMVVLL